MKKLISVFQAFIIASLIFTMAMGGDQIIQYNEPMVGANHPTLSDTLNRGFLIQHNAQGVHTSVPYSTLTDVPLTFPYDNLTGIPITFPYDNLTGVPAAFSVADNSITPAKLSRTTAPTNSLFYRGDGDWADPGVDVQAQLDAKQALDADLTVLSFPTAWRMFYSNGSQAITEFAMGAAGTYLVSQGASAAPIFSTLDSDLVTLSTPTAWRLYYSGASGYSALAFGDNALCLKSGGASAAPSWGACGSGDYDPADVAITGGVIDGVVIGGTVPPTTTVSTLAVNSTSSFGGLMTLSAGTTTPNNIDAVFGADGWKSRYDATNKTWKFYTTATVGSADDVPMFLVQVNSSGGTLNDGQTVFSVQDNNTALFKVTEGGDASIPNEFTASQYTSTGADGTHYLNVSNSTPPNVGTETVGDCYYNTGSLAWLCWDGDTYEPPAFTAIGSGTNPVVDSAGEIAVDTTATPDQLRYFGVAEVVLDARRTENATFKSPVSGDKAKFRKPYGITVMSVGCATDAATSAVLDVQECDANAANCATILSGTITCGTTYEYTDGTPSVSDSAIAAGGYVFFSVGTVTGTVGYLYVDFTYTVTKE